MADEYPQIAGAATILHCCWPEPWQHLILTCKQLSAHNSANNPPEREMKGWVHIFDFKLFAQPIDNIFLVHLVVVGSIAGCSKASTW